MAREGIPELPLYPEQRQCAHATTEQVLRLFTLAKRHQLMQHGRTVQFFQPSLTELQRQVLAAPRRPADGLQLDPVLNFPIAGRLRANAFSDVRKVRPEGGHEPLHRVEGVGKGVPLDQVLVDADGVAPELDLRLDPGAMRLARRRGRCRWPGWGTMLGGRLRAGGHHPRVICHRLVAADGLSIHPREALDLALRGPRASSVRMAINNSGFKTFTPSPSRC